MIYLGYPRIFFWNLGVPEFALPNGPLFHREAENTVNISRPWDLVYFHRVCSSEIGSSTYQCIPKQYLQTCQPIRCNSRAVANMLRWTKRRLVQLLAGHRSIESHQIAVEHPVNKKHVTLSRGPGWRSATTKRLKKKASCHPKASWCRPNEHCIGEWHAGRKQIALAACPAGSEGKSSVRREAKHTTKIHTAKTA